MRTQCRSTAVGGRRPAGASRSSSTAQIGSAIVRPGSRRDPRAQCEPPLAATRHAASRGRCSPARQFPGGLLEAPRMAIVGDNAPTSGSAAGDHHRLNRSHASMASPVRRRRAPLDSIRAERARPSLRRQLRATQPANGRTRTRRATHEKARHAPIVSHPARIRAHSMTAPVGIVRRHRRHSRNSAAVAPADTSHPDPPVAIAVASAGRGTPRCPPIGWFAASPCLPDRSRKRIPPPGCGNKPCGRCRAAGPAIRTRAWHVIH